jgi:UDP-N-acetylglucosamine 4,6-dehydratase/5-epimerase
MFSEKSLLITGGTGSFGNAVLRRLLREEIAEIRILSRDEKKQDDMRKLYKNNRIKFYIGDVRDYQSIQGAIKGVDFIFHAAALKQVPSCEFYPIEAVKTNILGTENVLQAAITAGVKKVVCLSTDKAVYPINAMGMSKGLMEKVIVANSRATSHTIISTTRYGNVMASRGSVIPLFLNQIQSNKPISITDPEMTRFMMTLDQAVELVLFAFSNASSGDIFVQKSPASTIINLADAIRNIMDSPAHPIEIIGTRHGEKLYEVLLSREEMFIAQDLGNYYRIPADNRDLNYDVYYDSGEVNITKSIEYTSHNTQRLSLSEMITLLNEVDVVSNFLKNRKF